MKEEDEEKKTNSGNEENTDRSTDTTNRLTRKNSSKNELLPAHHRLDIISNISELNDDGTKSTTNTQEILVTQSGDEVDHGDEVILTHTFEPGDHITRWSHFGFMYPIQIHGIVLKIYFDGSIKLIDFGFTHKSATAATTTEESKIKLPSNSRRLNVRILKNQKDINKWNKVNYGENFASVNFSKYTSWIPFLKENNVEGMEEDTLVKFPVKNGFDWSDIDVIQVVLKDLENNDLVNKVYADHEEAQKQKRALHDSIKSDDGVYSSSNNESITVASSTIEANRRHTIASPRQQQQTHEKKQSKKSQQHSNNNNNNPFGALLFFQQKQAKLKLQETPGRFISFPVPVDDITDEPEFFPKIFTLPPSNSSKAQPLEQDDTSITTTTERLPSTSDTDFSSEISHFNLHSTITYNNTQQNNKQGKLPKSDPTKLVLARVRFLLEFEDTLLPPYHVFNSNSECIAVWCKTGRWSTLQASIFLHSTAVGNAKQTVLALGSVAAINPLLIPAIAPLGIVYIGAPVLYYYKCKDTWERITQKLTDAFWAWAGNDVFVEVIQQWSGLK